MAEVTEQTIQKKSRSGFSKNKKVQIQIDLTPLVDLGFLLITFFIFSSTLSESTTMSLNMPKDSKIMTQVKRSGSLTIIPGKGNSLFYYFNDDPALMKSISYKNIREVILQKKKSTPPDDMYVIIKPSEEVSMKNVVNILDEMNVNEINRYSMVDASKEEIWIMQQKSNRMQWPD
ncbi:MAG: biopolymer transporter ExbD [Chitinophagaceae bacterium]|nr:biopolymer transporter ExbD [Chitinophagaceae bacterium]